jgi:transcriptional antiterminator RfaH
VKPCKPSSSESYWAVVAVQGNRNGIVQCQLTKDGFQTYDPKIKIQNRRSASLFPGYIMVRVFSQWWKIRWCPGVRKILMSGDRPAKLADAIVDEIRNREVKGFVKLPKAPTLEKGQAVRVTHGMFAGHVAVYEGMDGSQREKVLLDLLGRVVRVSLLSGQVETIDQHVVDLARG